MVDENPFGCWLSCSSRKPWRYWRSHDLYPEFYFGGIAAHATRDQSTARTQYTDFKIGAYNLLWTSNNSHLESTGNRDCGKKEKHTSALESTGTLLLM